MASSSSRFSTTSGAQSNNNLTSFTNLTSPPPTTITFDPVFLASASPSFYVTSDPNSYTTTSTDNRNWLILLVPVAFVIALFICIRIRDSKRRHEDRSGPERRIAGTFVPQGLLAMSQRTNIVGVAASNSRGHRRIHDLPPAYPGPPPPKYEDVIENDPLAAVQMRLEDREDEQPLAVVQRRLTIQDDERPLAELQRSLTSIVVEENRRTEDEPHESEHNESGHNGSGREGGECEA